MDARLVLTILCAAAELYAFTRLVAASAHRSYPWFATYLICGFLQSFVWLTGTPDSRAYTTAYRWTTPVILVLQIMVVLELCQRLMSCYRGIYHVSRALGFVALGAGTLLSFSTGFDGLTMWGHSLGGYTFHWLIWGVRYTASALCIASAILALWATFFDHGVPANLIRHSQLLAGYFGSVALAYLVVNLVRGSAPYAGAVATGCAAGFYVVWGRVLKPQGEAPIERLMAPRLDWISDLPSPLRRLIPY